MPDRFKKGDREEGRGEEKVYTLERYN